MRRCATWTLTHDLAERIARLRAASARLQASSRETIAEARNVRYRFVLVRAVSARLRQQRVVDFLDAV